MIISLILAGILIIAIFVIIRKISGGISLSSSDLSQMAQNQKDDFAWQMDQKQKDDLAWQVWQQEQDDQAWQAWEQDQNNQF